MTHILTDFYGKQYEVTGVTQRDDLLFATMKTNGDIPIYSIKYDKEFERYCNDHINYNDDIRDGGQSYNQGDAR